MMAVSRDLRADTRISPPSFSPQQTTKQARTSKMQLRGIAYSFSDEGGRKSKPSIPQLNCPQKSGIPELSGFCQDASILFSIAWYGTRLAVISGKVGSLRRNHHHFCVAAVDRDAGEHSVGAVDEVSSCGVCHTDSLLATGRMKVRRNDIGGS
jgi:hypothetical protein